MIPLVQQFFAFVIGCCLGSFFNVVIHRLPRKESLVHPGSRCPKCGEPIRPRDNIPVASYLLLGGKCRHCVVSISPRYPAVEALTGLTFLLLFRLHGLQPQLFIEILFCSLLVLVAFIDLDTFTIPASLSFTGIVAGFWLSFFTPRLAWQDSLQAILAGAGFFYLVSRAFYLLRGKEGLGGGDLDLLAMIGAFTGLEGIVFTIFAASVAGVISVTASRLLGFPRRPKIDPREPALWKWEYAMGDPSRDPRGLLEELSKHKASLMGVHLLCEGSKAAELAVEDDCELSPDQVGELVVVLRKLAGEGKTSLEASALKFPSGRRLLDWLEKREAPSSWGMGSKIPFGPFLSLGAVCYILWGEPFIAWYLDLITGN